MGSHPPGCRCDTQHSPNYRQSKMGGNEIPSEVTIYQDAFAHFDKTNSGAVSTKLLGSLLRFVGENPSDAEVQDLMNEVDVGSIGSFQFPNFLSMMLRKIDEISAEDEIREAFKVFDSVSERNVKHLNLTSFAKEWRW